MTQMQWQEEKVQNLTVCSLLTPALIGKDHAGKQITALVGDAQLAQRSRSEYYVAVRRWR